MYQPNFKADPNKLVTIPRNSCGFAEEFEKWLITHQFPVDFAKQLDGEVIVCGGAFKSFFLGIDPNDIDTYFKSDNACKEFQNYLHSLHKPRHSLDTPVICKTDDTVLFSVGVHVVTKFYGLTTEEVLSHTDIEPCMFGTDFRTYTLHNKSFPRLNRCRVLPNMFSHQALCNTSNVFRAQFNGYKIFEVHSATKTLVRIMKLFKYDLYPDKLALTGLVMQAGMELLLHMESGAIPDDIGRLWEWTQTTY